MISTQVALMRREVWEHRSLYVTPAVIALLVVLTTLTAQISIDGIQHVDMGIVGASNLPENARAGALNLAMVGMSVTLIFAMGILAIFYLLDSLYAERKDRSILFWRSLPTTDSETVISKLLTAMLVMPLIFFAAIVVTHLAVFLITSVWVAIRGGSGLQLIWASAPFLDNWTATLVFVLALPLWVSPFVGWFLFVSAFTKRSPLLTAFLPMAVLPMLERMIFDTSVIAEAIFLRTLKIPLFVDATTMERLFADSEDIAALSHVDLSLLGLMDIGGYLTSPGLWIGLVVCGLFTTAAIYVRRYRDES